MTTRRAKMTTTATTGTTIWVMGPLLPSLLAAVIPATVGGDLGKTEGEGEGEGDELVGGFSGFSASGSVCLVEYLGVSNIT